MAKSSSSHKKRDKISSKARMKKRSKSKSKSSKSEKYRSKKLRRRDDSSSYSDEDDSRNLSSDSSLSSEDDSRSRRARSRTRKDAKGSKNKKRARKSSHRRDRSEDSPGPRVKKRKLKKDKDYETKKNTRSKEKPRRTASPSSVSGGSLSSSTCRSGSISCDEIESEGLRGRPGKRKRDGSDIKKVESETGRSVYWSRSRSLHSHCSDSDYMNEEKVTSERSGTRLRSVVTVAEEDNWSGHCSDSDYLSKEKVTSERSGRRLRSVITVTEEYNQGRWIDEDGNKEEITYDHDDYPSCRSNDSNDGGSRREIDKERMRVESKKEEEAFVSDAQIMDLPKSGKAFGRSGGEEGIYSSRDETRNSDHVRESENEGAVANLKGDDLETILRQKALENLKRFKGKPQRTAITGNRDDKHQPSMEKAEPPKEDGARVVVAKSSRDNVANIIGGTQLVEDNNESLSGHSISSSQNLEKKPDEKNGGNKVPAKQDVTGPTHQVAVAGNSIEKVTTTAVLDKPNLAAPDSRPHSLKSQSTLKRASASQEPSRERLLETKSSVDDIAASQTVTQSSNTNGQDISNYSGSTAPKPSEEIRSDKQQDEVKDGSQFEQKTMSVMRGSEMVQVSYKVYIPKKTPALARRQLKR